MSNDVYNGMSNFEISRWIALFEAVNIVADKADDRNVDFKRVSIKQPAIENYIDKTCDNICRYLDEKMKVGEHNG